MEENEIVRLQKVYSEMPEKIIIEILVEDEKEYNKQPYMSYELLREEARKRGIEAKVEEKKRIKATKQNADHENTVAEYYESVIVYAGNLADATMLRSFLEGSGIKAYLRDEIMGGTLSAYVAPAGIGAVKVTVAKADLEKAKHIVKEFLQGQEYNEDQQEPKW